MLFSGHLLLGQVLIWHWIASGAEVQETVADFIKPSSPQPLAVQAELANLSMKSLSMGNLQGESFTPEACMVHH